MIMNLLKQADFAWQQSSSNRKQDSGDNVTALIASIRCTELGVDEARVLTE